MALGIANPLSFEQLDNLEALTAGIIVGVVFLLAAALINLHVSPFI